MFKNIYLDNWHVKNIYIFILVSLLNFGCVQTQNSSTGDQGFYERTTIDTSTPSGQRFASAYAVIKSSCLGCHANMNLTTDAAWINSGYIARGNPTGSILYCRIQGSGCGAEDMPKDSTISNDDLNKIKVWIENL